MTIPPSANSVLFSSLFALTTWSRRKKIQNFLSWCLSSVEGNDEAILSWNFYGLANNKDESEVFFRIKRSTTLQKLVHTLCTTVPWIPNH
ncbi:hypothetical protein ACE6H2_019218 [Prunus campanulata]